MKKYLKTTKEILKALSGGKDVYEESSSAHIFMKNGIIFRDLYGTTYINAEIDTSVAMYVWEKDPLILITGENYRVKDGRRAFISFRDDKVAYGCIENWNKICKWNLDDCKSVGGPDNTDIVSLWED